MFQDPAVKLKNQGQVKFRELGDQHHPNILVPSSRIIGLGQQSKSFVRAAGIKPGFPACGAAKLPQS